MQGTFLLLQIRNDQDPMRKHELECFANRLGVRESAIETWNLLHGPPPTDRISRAAAVLVGGSGDYSVVKGGPWLPAAIDAMQRLIDEGVPTFASCWGFQAMSLAIGGRVGNLPTRGHVGTYTLEATPAGRRDTLFGELGDTFTAQLGHEDVVTEVPDSATVLALSSHGDIQAWRIGALDIWGTQFHPELRMDDLALRLRTYPKYITDIRGMTWDEFAQAHLQPSPETDALLKAFAQLVL